MCVGGRPCSLPGPMISTDNLQHPLLTESPTIIRLSAAHCARKASGVHPVKQFLSNLCVLFLAGKYTVTSRGQGSHIRYQACHHQRTVATLSSTKHEYKILHFKLLDTSDLSSIIQLGYK